MKDDGRLHHGVGSRRDMALPTSVCMNPYAIGAHYRYTLRRAAAMEESGLRYRESMEHRGLVVQPVSGRLRG